MKVYTLYFVALFLLCSPLLNAQVTKASSSQSNQAKAQPAVNQKPVTMSQAADSIKYAVSDFKKSMNTLFSVKKDTIQIFVSDVEYDDANLTDLKESLKKIKGGKLVNMQYKASNAVLEVCFKGKSTQLWDEIPAESKKGFKILEANDNNLTLSVKK
ncbi:MAG: hypothetical protein ACXVLT_11010 [Flavisolibacter sp.]